MFYESQRAGALPLNNRVKWRNDALISDGQNVGRDLSGGYFDGGGFVKFGFPMASTFTLISWGVLLFEEAYARTGELHNVLSSVKWAMDYFLKCHVSDAELYGQVGQGTIEKGYWGRPEDMELARPVYKITESNPGTELACETAAALASSSLVLRKQNSEYASILVEHAVSLYDFGNSYRAKYHESIPDAGNFYRSWSGYGDELAWSALWIYKATGNQSYLEQAEKHYQDFDLGTFSEEFSWDQKKIGVNLLLSEILNDTKYSQVVSEFCDWYANKQKTPKGLAWIHQKDVLSLTANAAFACLQAGRIGIKPWSYNHFASSQIHYILGDSGRSYLVGFGTNPPQNPHHRTSSCPNKPNPCNWVTYSSSQPNSHVLHGAVVGGPDQNDRYHDLRSAVLQSEVSLAHNAGFQSAVAGLAQLAIEGDCC